MPVRKAAPLLLIGDIGGTHARLSLLTSRGRPVRHAVFESRKYASLEAVVLEFLGKPRPRVSAAVFGIAGPIVKGRCTATNLPWVIDSRTLTREIGTRRVVLINDLVALSLGALTVSRAKLHLVGQAGPPQKKGANVAVIAAGTGLGEAFLVWDGARLVPSATEGGHSDFSPRDDVQIELLQFLRARFGHVSWERALSGAGLGSAYDFFRQVRRVAESVENQQRIEVAGDRNAAIAELGIAGKSEAATRAVDLFVSMYGAEAGNLALKSLAAGGVFVCGNIAVSMLSVLDRGGFHRAFVDKGRFTSFMARVPVAVVLDSDVGLAGAARVAQGQEEAQAKRR
jgi:glucokinase